MTHSLLLGPVLGLIGWTLVMLVWTAVGATKGSKTVDRSLIPEYARASDLEGIVDVKYCLPRRNYEHLVEQPTLFYALMLALVFMNNTSMIALGLAWAYVGFRVIHSLAQATGRSRALGFGMSTLSLLILFVYSVVTYLG